MRTVSSSCPPTLPLHRYPVPFTGGGRVNGNEEKSNRSVTELTYPATPYRPRMDRRRTPPQILGRPAQPLVGLRAGAQPPEHGELGARSVEGRIRRARGHGAGTHGTCFLVPLRLRSTLLSLSPSVVPLLSSLFLGWKGGRATRSAEAEPSKTQGPNMIRKTTLQAFTRRHPFPSEFPLCRAMESTRNLRRPPPRLPRSSPNLTEQTC